MWSDGAYFRRQQSDSCGQPNTSASSWSPWHSWQQEDLHPWQQEQSRPQQVARSAHSEGGVSAPPLPLEPRQFDSAAAAEHVFLSPETTAMMQRHERVVEASARPPVQTQLPPWRLSSRGAGLVTPPMPPAASQRWRQQQQQEHQSSAGSAMPPKPLPTTSRLQHEQFRSAQPPPSPALSEMDLGTPLPPARNGSGHATLASARAAALIPWKQNQQRVVEGAVAPAAAPHSQRAEPAQAWAGSSWRSVLSCRSRRTHTGLHRRPNRPSACSAVPCTPAAAKSGPLLAAHLPPLPAHPHRHCRPLAPRSLGQRRCCRCQTATRRRSVSRHPFRQPPPRRACHWTRHRRLCHPISLHLAAMTAAPLCLSSSDSYGGSRERQPRRTARL